MKRLLEVQGVLKDEFKFVWEHLMWEDEDDLTPQQVSWARIYRYEWMGLGARAKKLDWEKEHPILEYVRKLPGLRRRIGVDDRPRMLWKHGICYLRFALAIMDGQGDDYSTSTL